MKPFTSIAIFIFGMVGIVHLLRLFLGWAVIVNNVVMPMWISAIGVIVAGDLAVMLWREMKK